jgi:hypothetical protein
MREMMRVAEVGLELGLDADVVVRRLAQRARQVWLTRRPCLAAARCGAWDEVVLMAKVTSGAAVNLMRWQIARRLSVTKVSES